MKKNLFYALAFGLLLSQGAWRSSAEQTAAQPQRVEQPRRVTLYSPLKYRHDQSRAYFSFKKGALAGRGESWEVGYGSMYLGKYIDWLTVSSARDSRSVIRDLGAHRWGDSFKLPSVEPMSALIAASGSHYNTMNSRGELVRGSTPPSVVAGKPAGPDPFSSASLPWNVRPPDFTDASRARTFPTATIGNPPNVSVQHSYPGGVSGLGHSDNARGVGSGIDFWPRPPREKTRRDPKGDVVSVRAVVGHMYVVHVVDGQSDYYALFRVEALERGDNCTITWKVVPAPPRPN